MFNGSAKWIVDFESLDGSFAADPATGGGIKIPVHRGGCHRHVRMQLHSHNIVKIVPLHDWSTGANLFDIVPSGDNPFGKQKSRGQFHILSGSPHGDRNTFPLGLAVGPILQSNFKWFFDRQLIWSGVRKWAGGIGGKERVLSRIEFGCHAPNLFIVYWPNLAGLNDISLL